MTKPSADIEWSWDKKFDWSNISNKEQYKFDKTSLFLPCPALGPRFVLISPGGSSYLPPCSSDLYCQPPCQTLEFSVVAVVIVTCLIADMAGFFKAWNAVLQLVSSKTSLPDIKDSHFFIMDPTSAYGSNQTLKFLRFLLSHCYGCLLLSDQRAVAMATQMPILLFQSSKMLYDI